MSGCLLLLIPLGPMAKHHAYSNTQFVEQLDITENSLFFGKKCMRFKSGDPLDIFYTKRQF
jgi:hypothetical protein